MSAQYAKNQAPGFVNHVSKVAIVGVSHTIKNYFLVFFWFQS